MTATPKAYRIEMKIRNNLILQRMEEAGFTSVAAFCRAVGLNQQEVGRLLNMKMIPTSKRASDGWRLVVRRMAAYLGVLPDELFTSEQVVRALPKNKAAMRIDANDMMALVGGDAPPPLLPSEVLDKVELAEQLEKALRTLTPREAEVIRRLFSLDGSGAGQGLEEIAKAFNVTRERIRQIESKALRKLRHPTRAKLLKPYLDMIK